MARSLLSLVLAVGAVSSAHAGPEPFRPHPWSPEVGEPLALYLGDQFAAAHDLALGIARSPHPDAVRRDAAAIQALCLLRGETRSDRLEGRQRLFQLAADAPTLHTDPECNLALGLAQIELHETADALDRLDRTVNAFRDAGRTDRQCAALVALAAAWAAHTEWELTVGRLLERRPADAGEADAVRVARIRDVQLTLGKLPESAPYAARVDLILARHLVSGDANHAEGRAILARLAEGDPLAGPAADAALTLAELLEREGNASAALALYERIDRDGPGALKTAAQARIETLRRPELAIEAPHTIRPGDQLKIDLRARGLRSIRVEVREVDLDRWLAAPQTRGIEAALPEAGRVVDAADVAIDAAASADWWRSADRSATVQVQPPPGAFVVIARGRDREARELVAKQLLNVTELDAACLIGKAQALIWTTRPGDAFPAGTAKFWMQRSFTPTEVAIKDGLAQFAIPAEAAVMRERGWMCLVRTGDQLALCRGTLPGPARPATAARTLLVCGPPTPAPDQPLTIAGLRRPGSGDPNAARDAELRVTDAMNDVVAKLPLIATPAGALQATLEPSRERIGRTFRLTPHEGNRALENGAGRLTFEVADRDPHRLAVLLDPLKWTDPNAAAVRASLQAHRPWGEPVAGLALWQLDVTALPESVGAPTPMPHATGQSAFDTTHAARLDAAAATTQPTIGVALAQLTTNVVTTDGGQGLAAQSGVRSASGSHVWLELEPDKPAAWRDATLHLGAFFPDAWPLVQLPHLRIERPDHESEEWVFGAGPHGYEIPFWRPVAPGAHHWSIRADADASPTNVRLSAAGEITLAEPTGARPRAACRAALYHDGQTEKAELVVAAQVEGPMLLIVEDGDILGALSLGGLEARAARIQIPLSRHAPCAAVHVVDARLQTLATCTAERREDQRPSVTVAPAYIAAWPGESATVDVLLERTPPGSVLIARLISSSEVGRLRSMPPGHEPAGLAVATSHVDPNASPIRLTRPGEAAADPLSSALLEGETLWCSAAEVDDERVALKVPLPPAAGRYHLLVAAETPSGEVGRGAAIFDTRAGLQVDLSAPVRLEAGDESCIGIHLRNLADRDRHVELWLDVDRSLALQRCAGLSDAAWRALRDEHAWTPLTLAPGSTWIRIDVAASAPGDAAIRLAVRGDDGETEARASCVVRAPVRIETAEPPLQVQRTITVWTPPRPDAVLLPSPTGVRPPPLAQRFTDAGWHGAPWTPDTTLRLGQVLHVVETITLEGARPSVAWRQTVPATCIAWRPAEGAQRLIGTPEPPRDATLTFRTSPLQPGTLTHEYLLGVSRPGHCRLPPPDLDLLGRPLRVAVTPNDLRLVVSTDTASGSSDR